MAVKFGPGGNSLSFGKRKFPDELPSYLASMGLDCYEIECGRGVRIAAATYEKLPALASGNNITVTLHAPYFISLSSVEAEKRDNSVNYIAESLRAADKLGAEVYLPPLHLCGDNGAMIGAQGYYEYLAGKRAGQDLNAYATMSLENG